MSKKADSAVAAASDTATQVGIRLQDEVQRGLILAHERVSAIVLVPVRAKRENFLERYDKKAKLSPIMQSVTFTPSCYFIAAKASRGRTRFFLRPRQKSDSHCSRTLPSRAVPQLAPLASSAHLRQAALLEMTTWKEEDPPPFFLPGSGALYLSRNVSFLLSGIVPYGLALEEYVPTSVVLPTELP